MRKIVLATFLFLFLINSISALDNTCSTFGCKVIECTMSVTNVNDSDYLQSYQWANAPYPFLGTCPPGEALTALSNGGYTCTAFSGGGGAMNYTYVNLVVLNNKTDLYNNITTWANSQFSGGNASWNETRANALYLNYANITYFNNNINNNLTSARTFAMNQYTGNNSLWLSTFNTTYAGLINNASYLTTYNSTYDAFWRSNATIWNAINNAGGGNASWNETRANQLYVPYTGATSNVNLGTKNTSMGFLNTSSGATFNSGVAQVNILSDGRIQTGNLDYNNENPIDFQYTMSTNPYSSNRYFVRSTANLAFPTSTAYGYGAILGKLTSTTGSYALLEGLYGYVSVDGNSNATSSVGGRMIAYHDGTGNITNNYGVVATTGVRDSGSITNNYGIRINNPDMTSTGNITNNYGLYIDDQNYGIRERFTLYADGSAPSFFKGNIISQGNINTSGNIDGRNIKANFLNVSSTDNNIGGYLDGQWGTPIMFGSSSRNRPFLQAYYGSLGSNYNTLEINPMGGNVTIGTTASASATLTVAGTFNATTSSGSTAILNNETCAVLKGATSNLYVC